jgi:hypothetical protein
MTKLKAALRRSVRSGAALPFIDLPQDRRVGDYLASFFEPDHSPQSKTTSDIFSVVGMSSAIFGGF